MYRFAFRPGIALLATVRKHCLGSRSDQKSALLATVRNIAMETA